MIGTLLLAVVQGVAGDTSAFATGVRVASSGELRVNLRRAAYVTVLRVWPDGIELAYPFDPREQAASRPATHQVRLEAGARWVRLTHALSLTSTRSFQIAMTPLEIRRECEYQGRPTPQRRRFEPAVRRSELCGGSSAPSGAYEMLVWESRLTYSPAPLVPPQLLTIVSAAPLDLDAVSQALDRITEPVAALRALAATLLAGHAGAWAAYVAEVN